jgi:hypothetical protein
MTMHSMVSVRRMLAAGCMALAASSATTALAQSAAGTDKPPAAVEVTDIHGAKHIVKDYNNGSRFFRAALPFDDNITDDYQKNGKGFWEKAKALKTAIAVELHNPEDEAKIRAAALGRGMRDTNLDNAHTVLLIPLPSLDTITFTSQKVGNEIQTRSVIQLSGEQPFEGGGGFWKLSGKEDLGTLGVADFAAEFSDIKSIRSITPAAPFVGDFRFFGATEVPFSAKVTDTSGAVTVLTKALYCTTGTFTVPNNKNTAIFTYGDVGLTTVRFKSTLDVKVGGTSSTSIPAAKLRSISVGKVDQTSGWGGYDAKATLRTGETVDLAIVPANGIYIPNGILGASAKGWVWFPWYAVASIDFEDR